MEHIWEITTTEVEIDDARSVRSEVPSLRHVHYVGVKGRVTITAKCTHCGMSHTWRGIALDHWLVMPHNRECKE